MAGPLDNTLRRLHRLVGGAEADALADRQLLGRYVAAKDESAFAALVRRHGPMVLGVCRRVLTCPQDAEDACQAAFLVLAKKAASISKRESLRCWLHGVAFRVSSNLRRKKLRRQAEPLADPACPTAAADDVTWREVRRVLDAELLRLPEQFRLPLLLCYLEGKTRDEAAEELGWSLSTFKGRLERGRDKLRARLERKGIGLPAALLAAGFAGTTAAATLPPELLESMARGAGSPAACALAEGAVRTMFIGKLKASLGALVVAGLIGVGVLGLRGGPAAVEAAPPAVAPEKKDEVRPEALVAAVAPLDDELAEKVKTARAGAIKWLKEAYFADRGWESQDLALAWPGGTTALATYALLDAGVKPADRVVSRALKYLRALEPKQTYVVALQTAALCRANDPKDAKIIQRNVDWLADAVLRDPAGKALVGWSYGKGGHVQADNSNTHYALMALYEAGRVNIKPKVPKFWTAVREMYVASQRDDGGWSYRPDAGTSTHSMTVAALCGLLAADDEIGAKDMMALAAAGMGFNWLAKNFAPETTQSAFYNLHAVARVGQLSGKQAFGKHDWFREGAGWLLKRRKDDGSFRGERGMDLMTVITTSYALLFLDTAPEAKPARKDPEKKAKDALPTALAQLAARADRIVVAWAKDVPDNPVEGEHASLEVSETLKGQPRKSLLVVVGKNDESILRQDSDKPNRWIVFLRSEDEGTWPKITPAAPRGWFLPYDKETLEKVRAAMPLPTEWDKGEGPIHLGLRLRDAKVKAGGEVVAEVVLKNEGYGKLPVAAHRMNIYDYWPHTTFEVTDPAGRKWVLEKPAGEMDEADAPKTIALAAVGGVYIHAMRLNVWRALPADRRGNSGRPVANLFTRPGEYTVRCRYVHTQVKGDPVELVSNAVKVVIEKDAKEETKIKAYRDHLDTFLLRLSLDPGPKGEDAPKLGLRTLDLHVANLRYEPHAKGPDGKPVSANVRITKEQAAKIVEVLAEARFFGPHDPRLPGEYKVPHAVMTASYRGPDVPNGGDLSVETEVRYFFDPALVRLLRELGAAGGEAGKQLDLLSKPVAAWAAAKELRAFHGRWKIVREEREGKEVEKDSLKGKLLSIGSQREHGHLIFGLPGVNSLDYALHVDPAATPKTIELAMVGDGPRPSMAGIYEFRGEKLVLCLEDFPSAEGLGGKNRPAAFKTQKGKKTVLLELVKAKPEDIPLFP